MHLSYTINPVAGIRESKEGCSGASVPVLESIDRRSRSTLAQRTSPYVGQKRGTDSIFHDSRHLSGQKQKQEQKRKKITKQTNECFLIKSNNFREADAENEKASVAKFKNYAHKYEGSY